ncbi:hypothetical protein B0H13DRAFT_2306634 [Mycena leptocephala]|nr:hypothetical protein B0H13DRAFT_2306634 [Mycena leptocephala]
MAPGRRSQATSNSPPVSSTAPTVSEPLSGRQNADWSTEETHDLLTYLQRPEVKAKAGDNGNFPQDVWTGASTHLTPNVKKGAPKTAKVYKNNYGQIRLTFKVVEHVAGNSGWHWDDKYNANIDAKSKSTWDDYVKAHPKAKPFRNRGRPFLAAMAELMPVGATGAHVYRPSQGAQVSSDDSGRDDDDDDDEGEKDADSGEGRTSPPHRESPVWDEAPPPVQTALPRHARCSYAEKATGVITPAPTAAKKPRGGAAGPAALSQLASSIADVGDSIRAALAPPDRGGMEATPRRKQRAILRAQQLEGDWLPEDQLVRFINILKGDTDAVDTYTLRIDFEFNPNWLN